MSVNRIGRINEEFRKELSDIIRNMKDPRIPMMTSVVTVKSISALWGQKKSRMQQFLL